jgi:hypothetical protein
VRPFPFFSLFSLTFIDAAPKKGWTHHAGGPRMRCGRLPNGDPQSFYFPDDHPSMPGWFKGMEQIIKERGLWPAEGLNAQCPNFHCPPGQTDCCCRRLLFSQPDFVDQKSQLQELIESRGHLCDFYPKYHCELNLLSSTGARQNIDSDPWIVRQPWSRWKKMSYPAWMTFPWIKSEGESICSRVA